MTYSWRRGSACLAAVLTLAAVWTIRSRAAALPTFQYNVIAIEGLTTGGTTVAAGEFVVVTFSVTNPQTGTAYDLKTDPAWIAGGGASRLFLQIGWNTRDFTNEDSFSHTVGGRGAAMPIPINALGLNVVPNGDGTYSVTSPLPVPTTATGTGEVAMEGHPAGQDADGAWTVRPGQERVRVLHHHRRVDRAPPADRSRYEVHGLPPFGWYRCGASVDPARQQSDGRTAGVRRVSQPEQHRHRLPPGD